MHEFSVASYLVESVNEHARRIGARRVTAINLVAGERACIMDDSLSYCFDLLAPGTLAEGATITVRRTPMQFYCERCDKSYQPSISDFGCPDCREVGRVTDDGSELSIESLEIEE